MTVKLSINNIKNTAFLFIRCKLYIDFIERLYNAPSVYRPRFIANLAYCQNSRLSQFPPLKIPRYTAKLSYRPPPQVFRHKSRKTNLNSPISTAHNYPLTAVY
jgi:hypothetical protein